MHIWEYILVIASASYSSSAQKNCDQDVSALQLELSTFKREISDLRQNYSRIQEELRRTQELVEVEEGGKTKVNKESIEEEVRRLKHTTRLLREVIKSYDDFVMNLEAPLKDALKIAAQHDGCTCEMDDPEVERVNHQMDEFRSRTMTKVTKIQKKIDQMFTTINKIMEEELV